MRGTGDRWGSEAMRQCGSEEEGSFSCSGAEKDKNIFFTTRMRIDLR